MSRRTSIPTDTDRMARYAALAAAFSYPGPKLFQLWPAWAEDEHGLVTEYDRLFRAQSLWLYGAEYLVENEFQRARMLSDIMGFYQAFGVEPDKDRPDALACELEFMHCLILKSSRIDRGAVPDPAGDKAEVCREAQHKFFAEHLAPAVAQIAPEVRARARHPFYRQAAAELLAFVEAECGHFGVNWPQPRERKREVLFSQQDSCGDDCV